MLSRRALLGGLAAAAVSGKAALAQSTSSQGYAFSQAEMNAQDWYVGYIPDEPFDIPFVDLRRLPAEVRRQYVRYDGPEAPGTVVIDTARKHLYLVRDDGTAIRYGIGVGREGFSWSGTATIGRKAAWPTWTPPAEMRRRQPDLPVSMEGGLDNPLGARAMYLHQNGVDTLFRIHGTNEPWSIGHAVSSGCIRMLNQDALDLYERVSVGAVVKVRERVRNDGLIMSESTGRRRGYERQASWGPVY